MVILTSYGYLTWEMDGNGDFNQKFTNKHGDFNRNDDFYDGSIGQSW